MESQRNTLNQPVETHAADVPASEVVPNQTADAKREGAEQWPEDIEQLVQVTESLDQGQRDVGNVIVDGHRQVSAIDRSVGLTADEAAALHRETGILKDLQKLHATAREDWSRIVHYTGKMLRRPIAHGEVFDSIAAYRELRAAPTRERPRLLREFKDKLSYQQRGLGEMREDMFELVRQQGAVDLPRLRQIEEQYASQYGFGTLIRSLTGNALVRINERNSALQHAEKQYPTGQSLFRALTGGTEPIGEIDIEYTPVNVHLRCHDLRDYTVLYYGGANTPDRVDENHLRIADQSGGCALVNAPEPGLQGAITVENVGNHNAAFSEEIFVHEQQHSINRLMPEFVPRSAGDAREMSTHDPEQLKLDIRRTIREYRVEAESRAKDEIMAYLKDGTPTEVILHTLLEPADTGGLYDYNKELKQYLREQFIGEYPGSDPVPVALINEALDDVLGAEYVQILENALHAVDQSSLTVDQLIGAVGHEPLRIWPKLLGRMATEEQWRVLPDEIDGAKRFVMRLKRRWQLFRDNELAQQ